jgi:hypothetical protein
VRRAEHRAPVESEHWQVFLHPEQVREVLVRLLLPAGRPHELERLDQAAETRAGVRSDAVQDAVDRVERARQVGAPLEAEQRDHSVDVDEENWTGVSKFSRFLHAAVGFPTQRERRSK